MKHSKTIFSIAGAFLFHYLFFDYELGVNQAIFGLLLVGISFWVTKSSKRNVFLQLNMMAIVLLSFAIAWHGESWTRFVHFWLCCLLAGNITLSTLFLPWMSVKQSVFAPFASFRLFVNHLTRSETAPRKTSVFNLIIIYLIPLTLIVLFVVFYRNSNPLFDNSVSQITGYVANMFSGVDFASLFTIFVGLVIMNMFLFPNLKESLIEKWSSKMPVFTRDDCRMSNAKALPGLSQVLKYEYKSALFLMAALNGILFFLNIADLKVVWFGFSWSGQLLKSFVHEGTWYLIFSILISVAVLLFVFRGNLNFYKNGDNLKKLAKLWLLQNAFLALSVGLRNLHYVNHYGLAYKRIGVFFFLLFIFAVLVLTFLKLSKNQTIHIWVNSGLAAFFGVLTVSAVLDWSTVIVKYNLNNHQKSFVHMEYLIQMPDRTLPYLLEYKSKFNDIKKEQTRLGYDYTDTINGIHIEGLLEERMLEFKNVHEKKKWQELSWADENAYSSLFPSNQWGDGFPMRN